MSELDPTAAIRPVESKEQLIAYLSDGARSQDKRFIGAELEKIVIVRETGEAAPYARIETLLKQLESESGWRGVYENDHLIALIGDDSSITLEPGGQLELSGALCSDIHCCHGDLTRHLEHISSKAKDLGLAFLGLGVQPFTPLNKIDWLPKDRYKIMGPYMNQVGHYGQSMMALSAGVQVNLDFTDEADCITKLRLGMLLSPLLYALFANSPLMNGEPTGFLSTRGEFWAHTDADRTGLIMELFNDGANFATYVDYALQIPMYFIIRDNRYIDLTKERFSFARFKKEGFGDYRATMEDWALHLSTIFPEVRLRPQIEVRSTDSLPQTMSLAAAALMKGLYYDRAAQADAIKLFRVADLPEAYQQSWRLGLQSKYGEHSLQDLARDILLLAREGLQRQKAENNCGLDETGYLDGLEEIVESGVTLAGRLLKDWRGSRADKVAALLKHCAFS